MDNTDITQADAKVNRARLKYQTKKKVTNPKLWSSMTEGQRQQWREWYKKEQELKNAKASTTNKEDHDEGEAIRDAQDAE